LHSATQKSINSTVSNGKRFIAYDLVQQLTANNQHLMLQELNNSLNSTKRKEGKMHHVFETSFDWKPSLLRNGVSRMKRGR